MPYLGRSPGSGVRSRFIYAATSGQTSFSGNDSNSVSLAYEDTLYMDVYQNGVLLKPVTDYAATTGTSVVLTTGATTDDVVEMIVYDTFAVADTVSASNGGTFAGDVAFTANANFGDSNKAQFGAGNDLQIFHDGSDSFISEVGTGNLQIRADDFFLMKQDGSEVMIRADTDSFVKLYHDGSEKLATASTGVDITGGFTATDGCTITTADNSAQLTLTSTDADGSAGPILVMNRDSGSPDNGDVLGQILYKFDNAAAESTEAIRINGILSDKTDGSEDARFEIKQMFGGSMFSFQTMSKDGIIFNQDSADIDFRVESDGNANMFVIDGGNNQIGIGTTPSGARLDINTDVNEIGTDILCENTSQTSDVLRVSASRNTTDNTYMLIRASCNGVADRFQVRDSGNVKNANNSYGSISDERMKENIVDAASQWDDIKALQVRKYNRLGETQKELGVIAQELEASGMGGLVEEGEYYDVANNPDKETRKSVKYSILYMKAVKALQEAMTRIETLEAKVTTLENA